MKILYKKIKIILFVLSTIFCLGGLILLIAASKESISYNAVGIFLICIGMEIEYTRGRITAVDDVLKAVREELDHEENKHP